MNTGQVVGKCKGKGWDGFLKDVARLASSTAATITLK